jgi:hypothetical protein
MKSKRKFIGLALVAAIIFAALSLTACPAPDSDDGITPTTSKTLVSIAATTTKTEYNINEDLDRSKITVTAAYSDKTTQAVTDYTTSGYDKTKTGNQAITVSYQGKTATFTVNVTDPSKPTVVKPTANPAAGAVASGASVTLTTTTADAEIWYTTNGNTPAKNGAGSTKYASSFAITPPVTVKAVAVKDSMNDSAVLEVAYTLPSDPNKETVATPTATPPAGTYTTAQSVTLTTTTADAKIYYTTNGTNPTTSSTLYSGTINIEAATTLKAIAVKEGMNDSNILTAVYSLPTTLTENVWAEGNLPPEQWFKFTATANTQYIHVKSSQFFSVIVNVYDTNGNEVGDSYFNNYTEVNYFSLNVTVGKEYFIKTSTDTTTSSAYQILFNKTTFVPSATLAENVWADGNLPTDGIEQWFKFTATANTQYIHVGFGTLGSMCVPVYDSSGTTVGSQTGFNRNTANKYVSQSVTIGQEYYIKIQRYSTSPVIGTYQIAFNATWYPPGTIQLAENVWADGNLPTEYDVQWFKFTATASTQYIHAGFGTLEYLYVQVYDLSGATVGSEAYLYSSTRYVSQSVTAGQEYYIRVRPSGFSGTYNITFNASATPPPLPPPPITVTVPGADLAAKLAWLKANAQSNTGYLVTVDKDESLAGTDYSGSGDNNLSYSGKTNIAILLTGDHTVSLSSNGNLFGIENGVTLILEQITLNGTSNKVSGIYGYGSVVFVYGALEMRTGSKITGNTIGGGVYVGGTFTMNGGEISGNTAAGGRTVYGGGVYVNGTFTMNGGEISGNRASGFYDYTDDAYAYGGGVYVAGGTFTMNGGEISGNTASATNTRSGYSSRAFGGGVHVATGGTFTMSNGKISGNTTTTSSYGSAYPWGGGVSVAGTGTFTLDGGEISGNTTAVTQSGNSTPRSYGGGVYKEGTGTFTMNGGIISGNTASADSNAESYALGGGVYVYSGTFTKSGGTITGYGDDTVNGNVVKKAGAVQSDMGHAVFVNVSPAKRRENTAGPSVNLDSTKTGAEGGWEN